MPLAARVRMPAVAVLIFAALSGRLHAEVPEGTYISIDDYRLIEEGLIVPILEFVAFERHILGGSKIESGYLRMLPDPLTMLDAIAWPVARMGVDPDALGRLDLPGTRRIALIADVEAAEDALRWTPEFFAMTSHEPGRLPREEEPRLSPFLLATEAAEGGRDRPSVPYRLEGDELTVTGPDGVEHLYGRADLEIPRMVGLIALDQEISIGDNHGCMRPIAEVLAAGEPFEFSAGAIDAMRTWAETEGPDASATWAEMERRGLGRLQSIYFATADAALTHTGRFLQSRIERAGGLAAMLEGWDGQGPVVDESDAAILMYLTRMFYFDFDYVSAQEPPFDSPRDLLAIWEAQYAADPFSVVSPFAVAYLDPHGWIIQLNRLLYEELRLRCPDVAAYAR